MNRSHSCQEFMEGTPIVYIIVFMEFGPDGQEGWYLERGNQRMPIRFCPSCGIRLKKPTPDEREGSV